MRGTYSQRGAPVQNRRKQTPPIAAPAQAIVSRIAACRGGSSRATASGVYVPAMMRKMLAWSKRRSIIVRSGGDQVPPVVGRGDPEQEPGGDHIDDAGQSGT